MTHQCHGVLLEVPEQTHHVQDEVLVPVTSLPPYPAAVAVTPKVESHKVGQSESGLVEGLQQEIPTVAVVPVAVDEDIGLLPRVAALHIVDFGSLDLEGAFTKL
jgi:hypothetical protein